MTKPETPQTPVPLPRSDEEQWQPQGPQANRFVVGGIDRVLTVQRPAVLAHLHSIRSHHPDATPEQVIRILERRYLTAVTTGGALVGASAVIPGVGIGASLALSTVETGGFLEASALFAQSVTEVHGIAVDDPDRARTLVMTLILGSAGSDLVKQLAGQATGKGPVRNKFWGEMVTKSLPQAAMGQIADRLKKTFLKRFAVTQGTNIVGRAIPFGIGAVVGGTGNNLLGRQVVRSAREAFRAAPAEFPAVLALRVRAPKLPKEPKEPRVPRSLRGPKQPKPSRAQRALDRAQRDFPVDPAE
jgi:hypothetical protein